MQGQPPWPPGQDVVRFARKYVAARLEGFDKDMCICMIGIPRRDKPRLKTHAYFPALMTCCATLEFFTALSRGNVESKVYREPDIARYASRYMPAEYDAAAIRILWLLFRNKTAHLAVPGFWFDVAGSRRFAWTVDKSNRAPALAVTSESGSLRRHPLWSTTYTHRVHVRLLRLRRDITGSARKYVKDLSKSPDLQEKFMDLTCSPPAVPT